MGRMQIFILVLLLNLGLLLPDAYAYIDPSTGILGLQALIAALISVLIFIKSPIKRFKTWLIKRKERREGP